MRRSKASAIQSGTAAIGIQNSGKDVKSRMPLARTIEPENGGEEADLRAEQAHAVLPEPPQVRSEQHARR